MKILVFSSLALLSHAAIAEWKFGGQAGQYVNTLTIPSSPAPATKSGIYTELKLDNKWDQWKFKSELALRSDFLAKDSVETVQFLPKNFYLQRKFDSLIFKLGYQVLSLDGPDIVNPADIVHSKNWIDPTAPITLGSPGLSMAQELGNWNWELFYIPYQTTPVLPGAHSPWLPRSRRLPIESNNLEIRIPDDAEYRYGSSKTLHNALVNNFSAKLQRKSENLELQFIYYQGLSQTPFVLTQVRANLSQSSPIEILQVTSAVKLTPLYYSQQAIAGTFLIPLQSWAIKGGVNWMKPDKDYRVPGETNTAVVGVEKNIETSKGMLTGIVQYINQQRLISNQISFLRSFFQKAWSVGLRVPWGEETSFLFGGIYDQVGKSSIYRASLSHRFTNSWSMEAGAQYLEGPKETLVGLYSRYDSYQLKLLYSW